MGVESWLYFTRTQVALKRALREGVSLEGPKDGVSWGGMMGVCKVGLVVEGS